MKLYDDETRRKDNKETLHKKWLPITKGQEDFNM